VGDSFEMDLKGAEAAGAQAFLLCRKTGHCSEKELPSLGMLVPGIEKIGHLEH
jgi:hypothetical protein